MRWSDPNSPWYRRQARRTRLAMVSPALTGAFTVAAVVWLSLSATDSLWDSLSLTLIGIFALFTIHGTLIWWRERDVLRGVTSHDGAICGRCRKLLPDGAHEDPQAIVACDRCGTRQSLAGTREAWEQYHFHARRPGRAPLDVIGDVDPARSAIARGWSRWRSMARDRVFLAVLMSMAWMVGIAIIFALVLGQSVVGTLFEWLPMILFVIGITLFGQAWSRRIGASRHCVDCNYEMPPTGAGDTCPECGAAWSKAGGTARGRSRRRPALILAGGVMIILSVLMHLDQFRGVPVATRLQPTNVIIGNIVTGTGWNHKNWPALQARTLTDAQTRRLAEGLLDQLEAGDFVARDGHAWIQARMQAGELDPELEARYVGRSVTVTSIEVLDAVAGRPVRLQLQVEMPPQLQLSTAGSWNLLVDGVELLDASGAVIGDRVGRGDAFMDAWSLSEVAPGRRGLELDGPALPAGDAGPVRARVRLTRAILPWGAGGLAVTRREDGTARMPATVVWWEPMVVEVDIPVGGDE